MGSFGQGRLGNQLSNFASCYALMKDYGMYHYLNSFQLRILQNVFVLQDSQGSNNSSYYIWDEGKYLTWAYNELSGMKNKNIMIYLIIYGS